jgi:hypothetical protein
MDKPKAIAIPRLPNIVPAMAALPQPKRTRTIVPINSEIYLFIKFPLDYFFSLLKPSNTFIS